MRTSSSRAPATARVLWVLVLLTGLFGMHGLAQSQATGCHGAAVQPAAMTSAPMGAAHGGHAVAASHGMRDSMGSAASPAGAGDVCQAIIPQRSGLIDGVSALALVTTVLAGALALASLKWARPRWRAPPLSGVILLHRVCVWRT